VAFLLALVRDPATPAPLAAPTAFAAHLLTAVPLPTLFACYLAAVAAFVAGTLLEQLAHVSSGFLTNEVLNRHKKQYAYVPPAAAAPPPAPAGGWRLAAWLAARNCCPSALQLARICSNGAPPHLPTRAHFMSWRAGA
jgi:hypothetical protein